MNNTFAMKTKTSAEQMEVLICFMEQHGDLNKIIEQAPVPKIEQMQKWAKLTSMLNETGNQPPRPTVKWKKVWSDLKNNTKRKYRKLKSEGVGAPMSHLELRVMRVLGAFEETDKTNHTDDDNDDDDDDNDIQPVQTETKKEPIEMEPEHPRYFYAVNCPEPQKRPSSSASSYAPSISIEPPIKRKRGDADSLTHKYFDFEKKREEMLHEREMARIKQEEQRLGIYSRLVNVLETLAPCVKRYLDRN